MGERWRPLSRRVIAQILEPPAGESAPDWLRQARSLVVFAVAARRRFSPAWSAAKPSCSRANGGSVECSRRNPVLSNSNDEAFRASLEKTGFPPLRPRSRASINEFETDRARGAGVIKALNISLD
jgi:hypothetical protein